MNYSCISRDILMFRLFADERAIFGDIFYHYQPNQSSSRLQQNAMPPKQQGDSSTNKPSED